jgi:two-component system sensor histidine kinase CpxA
MRSLFLKIFLSFWLATALFVALAVLLTLAARQQGESAMEARQAQALSEAVHAYESGGQAQLRGYLDNLRDSQHLHAFLLNQDGAELSGRMPPGWSKGADRAHAHRPRGFWGWMMMPMRPQPQSMTSDNGRRYTLVVLAPPPGPSGAPWLTILIAIMSSGLVCYFLARYLTSPVVRLRAATQKLAEGDLTARAGTPGIRRHDEMAELVRDFDGMAERLQGSVNAQSRLLSDISHELRSPLARLSVALALASQRAGPEAQSALERIDLEANRLNELIGRLLTVARLESGDGAMQKSPVHLEELVREIAKDADFEAQGRQCRVVCVVTRDCVVMGTPALLHSAIENVVRNATRYTREGTNVEVRLDQAEGSTGLEAILQVMDSGPGVAEDALQKMFRPFYRIDDARGRQTGGVGLGLAITERTVRLHGGRVKAMNRPEGGLVVEIRLPLAGTDAAEPVPPRSASVARVTP